MTVCSGLCMHGDVSTDHKSANRIKLHDPAHTPTHNVSIYHKCSHRINLSPLGQDVFHYSDLT